MSLLLLAMICSGLLSLTVCLLCSAGYGLGLILLAAVIRHARQDISRKNLCRLLALIMVDHVMASFVAVTAAILIVTAPPMRDFMPLVQDSGLEEEGLFTSIALILICFAMLWVAVAVLLNFVRAAMKPRINLQRELELEPWLSTMVAVGATMQCLTGFFFLLIAAPLIWQIHRIARIHRQSNLIWTLTLAVTRGLPLGREVLSLSEGLWGRQRLRVELLSENLDAGQSIANSLERQPGLVPFSIVTQIRLGEETGTLRQVLQQIGAGQIRRHAKETEVVSVQQAFMILLIPLTLMPLVVSFVGYYIIPKLKKIMEDFGVENHQLSKRVFSVMDGASGFPFLMAVGGFAAALVAFFVMIRDWERDWPLLSWLAPRVNAPPILRSLALLTREHSPYPEGLGALESSHIRPSVRRQISAVLNEIDRGGGTWEALAKQRLINRRDLALLQAAEKMQNLPWALEQIADTIERRSWQWMRVLLEVGFPMATILIGLFVLLFTMAIFLPLITILNAIA